MRLDVLTIFPDYLAPLDLSLVGKAREAGTLDLAVHDLRDWTTDRHRSVDDTPFGGGAGMVMRPDVWGAALDDVLAHGAPAPGDEGAEVVLLVPTPAGEPFSQRVAAELAAAQRLVIACGRYEGIDARVTRHYAERAGVRVREVSIGDYVLNGGEVAALVITEAVVRLLPGVLGNPYSLVEESHGEAGLLEYPSYTKPPEWRGLAVPEVLRSGHHGRVAAWRREQALRRTAHRRPDLLERLDATELDRDERRVLGGLGWYRPAGALRLQPIEVRDAVRRDAAALADLAAVTFPLACPPSLPAEAVAAFIAEALSTAAMAGYLADEDRLLLVAAPATGEHLLGYTMLVEQPDAAGEVVLDKCYVHPDHLGSGLADSLLRASIERAVGRGATRMVLGTNVANRRAQRFYTRHGFALTGRRSFEVGGEPQDDVVMSLDLEVSGAAARTSAAGAPPPGEGGQSLAGGAR